MIGTLVERNRVLTLVAIHQALLYNFLQLKLDLVEQRRLLLCRPYLDFSLGRCQQRENELLFYDVLVKIGEFLVAHHHHVFVR